MVWIDKLLTFGASVELCSVAGQAFFTSLNFMPRWSHVIYVCLSYFSGIAEFFQLYKMNKSIYTEYIFFK